MLKAGSVNLALLGHPVEHSQSPKLHNQWILEAGLSGRYEAISIADAARFDLRATLTERHLTGVNITTPLKETVFEQVDVHSTAAQQAGAVNTVVWRDGQLVGHNTDGDGFLVSMLREGWQPSPTDKVVLLGAGGAARGIASALVRAGVKNLVVLNRTEARARDCVAVAGRGVAGPLTEEAFESLGAGANVVVHTTSGQGASTVAQWSIEGLATGTFWVDINYWMTDPPQRTACEAHGLRFVGGWPMLVCQAAMSFQLFTGFEPNPDPFLLHLR